MRITLIGLGTMGSAIAKKLTRPGMHLTTLTKDEKVKGSHIIDYSKPVASADIVIIAVKPQDVPELARQIVSYLQKNTIIISIAAGITIQKLGTLLHAKKIIRTMPNLGLAVGQGIMAWKSSGLTPKDKEVSKKILDTICENFEVSLEQDINTVTAISGSGPAYFFYLAEQMMSSALKLGLKKEQAATLVRKTLLAAAELQTQGTYSELITKIASKKGTTEAALKIFHSKKADKIIAQAIQAAAGRAKELSHG